VTSVPANTTPLSWPAKLAEAARDIKLAHSVFALPFALLGAFLAASLEWRTFAGQLVLIVGCMVGARSFAMLANRFVDRRFDAHNPRTARRAFAAGRLSTRDGVVLLIASAAIFEVCASGFWIFYGNPTPTIAGPFVLVWLAFYSYTKRFTALCHLVLGVALALSPIAAAIAVGGADGLSASVYLLAAFIACWVAGFDVIYAMQDEAFDRERGLRSIPAALGTRGAAWTSRALHAVALTCLVLAGSVSDRLGVFFTIATVLTALLLITEHAVLAKRGHAGIPMAFFTFNGVIAILLGAAGIADVLVG
jgi:4-hydroxybenzoate polyprenyltransferase